MEQVLSKAEGGGGVVQISYGYDGHNWSNGSLIQSSTSGSTYAGQVNRERLTTLVAQKKKNTSLTMRFTCLNTPFSRWSNTPPKKKSQTAAVPSFADARMLWCNITFDGYQGITWQALLDDKHSEDSSAQQHSTPAPVQQASNYSTAE